MSRYFALQVAFAQAPVPPADVRARSLTLVDVQNRVVGRFIPVISVGKNGPSQAVALIDSAGRTLWTSSNEAQVRPLALK
jgi:hypothetical protein